MWGGSSASSLIGVVEEEGEDEVVEVEVEEVEVEEVEEEEADVWFVIFETATVAATAATAATAAAAVTTLLVEDEDVFCCSVDKRSPRFGGTGCFFNILGLRANGKL